MTAKKPWYENTFRFAQTNFTEDDPANLDLNFWRKHWRESKAQAVVINAGGIVAYYPSQYTLHYRAKYLGEKDFFGEVAEAAREEGLKVIARMDTNRADRRFLEAYPSWFCRNKEGEYIQVAGRYYSCVNSGYYTEFIPDILREIIERYHPEGFTDNNWKGLDRNHICYCENCRTKFREYCGKNLPEQPNWQDKIYRIWVKWNYEIRLQIWDSLNQVVQEKGGEHCLWCGMLNADPIEQGNRFVDIKKILKKSKIIFCDQQGRRTSVGMEENAVNGSLLRLASTENKIIPESMAHYVRGRRTFRLSASPKAETRLWITEGIAGGLSPWFHHVGGKGHDKRQYEISVPLLQWHEKNQRYLYRRQEIAEVGVLWSQDNTDFYGREDPKNRCELPWMGFTKALAKHRVPFMPIHADDVERYQERIKVLILPDTAVLSEAQTEQIVQFCRAGGSLVLSGLSGTLSEDGTQMARSKLWDYLGLKMRHGYQGPSIESSGNWENFEAHTYAQIDDKQHSIFRQFHDTDLLAFGGRFCGVESVGPLKPVAFYIPSFPIFPPEFSWIRKKEKKTTLVWAGEWENENRCVYLAGDFDRCYGRDRLPDHGVLLAEAVRWAGKDSSIVSVAGPGEITVKLYQQENRLVLHVVNITGASPALGYAEEMLSLGPYMVTLNNKRQNIKSVFSTVQEKDIPFVFDGEKLTFCIETISMHEMLVIQ